MPRKLIILAVIIAAAVVTIGFIAMRPESFVERENNKMAASAESTTETGVTVGKRLPEFTLSTLQGKAIKVVPGRQVLVLNFWATWCPPCRQEMPELEKFSRQYNGKVEFYAINIQESVEKVTEFMSQNQYSMQVLTDKNGAMAKTFHVTGIPTTLVIDKQGIIKFRKTGPVTVAELEGVLNGL